MSAGYPVNKAIIDDMAGRTVIELRRVHADIVRVKAWLDGQTDQALEAFGYTTDDVALLKSAYTDLAKLVAVAEGRDTQADASNFLFFAGRLTGLS